MFFKKVTLRAFLNFPTTGHGGILLAISNYQTNLGYYKK